MLIATWNNQRVRVLDVIRVADIVVGDIEPHLWRVPIAELTNISIETDGDLVLPFDYKSDCVSYKNLKDEE